MAGANELSEALGAPRVLTAPSGAPVRVRPLNFNDLCVIEERFGSVEALDLGQVRTQRFLLALVFGVDEQAAGALLPLDRSAEATRFVIEVFRLSGLLPDAEESSAAGAAGASAEGNDPGAAE